MTGTGYSDEVKGLCEPVTFDVVLRHTDRGGSDDSTRSDEQPLIGAEEVVMAKPGSSTTDAVAATGDGKTAFDPNAVVEHMRTLRQQIAGYLDDYDAEEVRTEKRVNAEVILDTLRSIRESIPFPLVPVPQAEEEWPADIPVATDSDAIEIFEYQAVIDGLKTLSAELEASLDASHAKLIDDCLRVYFVGLELVRDPANAHLIPHLEAMRAGYEQEFGRPIPTREEWEKGGGVFRRGAEDMIDRAR
jgi:hypothetical protein